LTEFVEHGRRVKTDRSASVRNQKRPAPRTSPAAIREWAAAQGIAVSPRGRISARSAPNTRPPNPGDDAVSAPWFGVRRLVSVPLRAACGLLGELELLALQLPPVVQPDDPDRAEIIALRVAIMQLIIEINHRVGRSHLSCAD